MRAQSDEASRAVCHFFGGCPFVSSWARAEAARLLTSLAVGFLLPASTLPARDETLEPDCFAILRLLSRLILGHIVNDSRRWSNAFAFFVLLSGPICAEPALVGVASVIDGDTIELHDQHIRLEGIDAPESGQACTRPDGSSWRCGQVAAFVLADKIGLASIWCEPHGRDRYGRIPATCWLGAEDLGRWLVSEGLAVAYRRFSVAYVDEEEEARAARRGIWSSTFTIPEDWRQSRRR